VEAKSDRAGEPAWARDELKAEPRKVAVEMVKARHRRHVAAAVSQKSKASGRTHLARRHRNPLDAQAMDTRIQTWPCKSGGICNWRHAVRFGRSHFSVVKPRSTSQETFGPESNSTGTLHRDSMRVA
jgi:hypothetical protein